MIIMASYTEKVGSVFNNELIKMVCRDIDNDHWQTEKLKAWLPQLIAASVDLSVMSLSTKPYQDAYDFVIDELYTEKIIVAESEIELVSFQRQAILLHNRLLKKEMNEYVG
jgi:hypothetical protein